MAPVEFNGGELVRGSTGKGPTLVTNIYRATLGDGSLNSASEKKRPDTYASGSTDWTA